MANESENILLHFKRTESNGCNCIQMIEKSVVEMEKMNVEPKEPNSFRRVVGLMASRPVENQNTIDGTAYGDNQTKNISSLGDAKSKVVGNSTESQYYNYHQYATNFVHSLQTPKMASTLDDFEVIATIGTGSYGTCKKIQRKKDGKIMVWKEMDYGSMTEAEKQLLVSEVNLLRELKHRHIVRYYDRIIDRTRSVIYILMEYCQGGDLATLIARCRKEGTLVEEDFSWKILIQTTLALKECHRRKNGKAILHRDLKPANIFLDKHQNVKLGDFGLARVLHHDNSFAQTYVGTPYYMSPELVNNMSYNDKSDIWALGCLMYELCALHPPFTANNQMELNRKIRLGDFPRLPSKFSTELDKLIRKMIKVEVTHRPSIDEILSDPLVCRQIQQLEQDEEQTVCSASLENGIVVGIGNKKQNNSSCSSKEMSIEWAAKLRLLQEEYKHKLKQLELKERELESRERSVNMREKEADEKMKRAMFMLEHYRRRSESLSGDQHLFSGMDSPALHESGKKYLNIRPNERGKPLQPLPLYPGCPDSDFHFILNQKPLRTLNS